MKKVEKKKPDVHPTKKALDKVVTANGACVMGILKSSLAPELQAATKVCMQDGSTFGSWSDDMAGERLRCLILSLCSFFLCRLVLSGDICGP